MTKKKVKLNSVIITSSAVHTLFDGKITKSLFDENDVETVKDRSNTNKILLLGPVE